VSELGDPDHRAPRANRKERESPGRAAGGRRDKWRHQVAIYQALRSYLRERERSRREHAATNALEALDDEAVQQKLRAMR